MCQRCGTEKVQKQKDAEIKKDRRLIAVLATKRRSAYLYDKYMQLTRGYNIKTSEIFTNPGSLFFL